MAKPKQLKKPEKDFEFKVKNEEIQSKEIEKKEVSESNVVSDLAKHPKFNKFKQGVN